MPSRPKPPFSTPPQDPPGYTDKMVPIPDHGEKSYKGSGRLSGKRAIITGGDSGIGVAIAYAVRAAGEYSCSCPNRDNEHGQCGLRISHLKLHSKLSSADLALIEPHLEQVDLAVCMMIEQRAKEIQHLYFVDSGIVSIVANGSSEVEVGIVGRLEAAELRLSVGANTRLAENQNDELAAREQ